MSREGAESLRRKYMEELRQKAISARDEAQAEIDQIEAIIADLIDDSANERFGRFGGLIGGYSNYPEPNDIEP